jgi:poly(A) polymerase
MKKTAIKVIQKIKAAGYQAVFCGGFVRDLLLGEKEHDIDIATDCPIDSLKEIFPRCILVGENFGVIRIVEDGYEFEIAQFRKDSKSGDGRRPDSVEFCNMEEDAQRRDFTINGLFADYDSKFGYQIIDFVGGKKDIEDRKIRFIGNALERIEEDFLRMMRFCRFSARFGNYDQESLEAVKANAHNIGKISKERIKEELKKGFALDTASLYLDLLVDTGIMQEIIPEYVAVKDVEQSPVYHKEGCVGNHVKLVLECLKGCSIELKLAGFFHDIGKSKCTCIEEDGKITSKGHAEIGSTITYDIMKRLKFSNDTINYVVSLVRDHMKMIDIHKWGKAKQKKFLVQDNFSDLLVLHKADKMNRQELFDIDSVKFAEELVEKYKNEVQLPKPFINGKDIIFLGLTEGKEIGKVKEYFYDMQLEGDLLNRESALLKAEEMIRDYYLDKLLKNT